MLSLSVEVFLFGLLPARTTGFVSSSWCSAGIWCFSASRRRRFPACRRASAPTRARRSTKLKWKICHDLFLHRNVLSFFFPNETLLYSQGSFQLLDVHRFPGSRFLTTTSKQINMLLHYYQMYKARNWPYIKWLLMSMILYLNPLAFKPFFIRCSTDKI